jgi:FkbM family methyltransferase
MIYSDLEKWDEYIRPTMEQNVSSVIEFIGNNDFIVDIGANTGMFTRTILEKKPNISAALFEPIKELSDYAGQKLSGNKAISIYNYALVETKIFGCPENKSIYSERTINCGRKNLGWNTMLDERLSDDNVDNKTKINCVGFDDFNSASGGQIASRIDFIKLDTEGYEWQVITGMFDAIEKNMPIIFCEIGFGRNHPYWDKEIAVFERLFNIGYKPFDIRAIAGTTDVLIIPEKKI